MSRRKPARPIRRDVIGSNVGGPIPRSSLLDAPDGPRKPQQPPPPLLSLPSPAHDGASLDVEGSERLEGLDPAVVGTALAPLSPSKAFSIPGAEGTVESYEGADKEEEKEDEVVVSPASSRKRLKTHLNRLSRDGSEQRSPSVEGRVARCFPVQQDQSALLALTGLRIVVPPPPCKALLLKTPRAGRLAVPDEDLEDEEEASGVVVELAEGWKRGAGSASAKMAQTGGMLRIRRDVFEAVQELDRAGYIAVTAKETPVTVASGPSPLSSPGESNTPPTVVEGARRDSAATASLRLEVRVLESAFASDGPRISDVGNWKLLIGWLFPRVVEGFFRPPGRHSLLIEDETPPSPAEILHALDSAKRDDPDLRTAIHRGPRNPLPALPALREIDLRNHQKAAIRWMLDAEKKMNISLSAFALESLVSRDGFGSPVPRQPADLYTQAESGAYLRDFSRFPRRQQSIQTPDRGSPASLAQVDPTLVHPGRNLGGIGSWRHSMKDVMARNAAILGWVELPLPAPSCSRASETGTSDKVRAVVTSRGDRSQPSKSLARVDDGGIAGKREGLGELAARPGHVWFHAPSGRFVERLPEAWVEFSRVSGGILADEMGLGKTVEVLGCILANARPSPDPGKTSLHLVEHPNGGGYAEVDVGADNPKHRQEQRQREKRPLGTNKSAYWDDLTPTDAEGSACICGRGDDEPLRPGDLCFVQCDRCGWWLHGGCCGFVPTEEEEEEREFICVACSCLRLLRNPQRCGSTLIICPHKIRSQWEREIRFRTQPGALKVVAYPGVREILSVGGKGSSNRRARLSPRGTRGVVHASGETQPQPRGTQSSSGDLRGRAEERLSAGQTGVLRGSKTLYQTLLPPLCRNEINSYTHRANKHTHARNGSGDGNPQNHNRAGHSPGSTVAPAAETTPAVPSGIGTSSASGESGIGEVEIEGEAAPFALLSPEKLASYDVVLTTFDVLRAEVHHAESKFANQDGLSGSVMSLRKRKRYRVIPSPLPALKWWRVVIDEAHMVESTTQETAKMTLKIPATHRRVICVWCVTGTPLGKGSIDDIFGLLVFLKASPLDSKAVWTSAIREPIDQRLPGAMERLTWALKHVMWRVTKASVSAQIDIPQQTCVDRRLSFSSVEAHFYQKQHRAAADDARR
ncbi:unnamed protein product [Ascophyllum nodosum]